MLKLLCYHNLLQHATQIELLHSMLHPSTYDDEVCVWTCSITGTTSPYVKVRCSVFYLLKARNRALASIGFIMQHAPHSPLPTGHHSNDLVHCPPPLFPTTTLYYATSLEHRHPICRAIGAGECVEHCANCSPSRHSPQDSLCRCCLWHLVRHAFHFASGCLSRTHWAMWCMTSPNPITGKKPVFIKR